MSNKTLEAENDDQQCYFNPPITPYTPGGCVCLYCKRSLVAIVFTAGFPPLVLS